MLSKPEILKSFTNFDIKLTDKQLDDLYIYYQMIEQKNQVMNLTGFTEKRLVEEGLIESILLLQKAFDISKNQKFKLLDIGAGAGFPSVPYLILNRDKIELFVAEPLQKRCKFLQEVSDALDLKINIINDRVENIKLKEFFDLITARAVMELKKLIEVSCQLGKINSQQVFIKGQNVSEEIAECDWIKNQLKIDIKSQTFNLSDIRTNNLISVIKNVSCPANFPRKWATINKK